jgi:sigma-B regulation protein RsbU (phosphoserine phosphatase)
MTGRPGDGLSPWYDAIARLLHAGHVASGSDLPALANSVMKPLGVHVVIHLADLEQRALRALVTSPGRANPPMPIEGSLAGRAFMMVVPTTSHEPPGRLWLPLVDGTERLGVLEILPAEGLDPEDDTLRRGCDLLASLLGHLIVAKVAYGDTISRSRRSQPLSTAAQLLWRLLPPLTFANGRMVISAILEPCYDVGGDAFDYAVDGDVARLAVIDAVGHGLDAGLTVAVGLSALRAARIAGGGLVEIAAAADEALTGQFADVRFATGVLAELDLDTGTLSYVNAGHPPAVLIRSGRAVAHLQGGRRLPLGLVDGSTAEPATEVLEPGDRVLFYTDGVVEARNADGEAFGVSRLVDVAEKHAAAGLTAPETLRRVSHAIIDHQGGQLQDDATLVLLEWSPSVETDMVP